MGRIPHSRVRRALQFSHHGQAKKAEKAAARTAAKEAKAEAKAKAREEAKAAKKRAGKDPNRPKKALSAYMIFSGEVREATKAELPEDHKNTDVMKAVAAKWKALSDADKAPWQAKAEADKARAAAALAEYESSGKGAAWAAKQATAKAAYEAKLAAQMSDESDDDDSDDESDSARQDSPEHCCELNAAAPQTAMGSDVHSCAVLCSIP